MKCDIKNFTSFLLMSLVHTDSYSDFSESSDEANLNWYLLHESFDKFLAKLDKYQYTCDELVEIYNETYDTNITQNVFSKLKEVKKHFNIFRRFDIAAKKRIKIYIKK